MPKKKSVSLDFASITGSDTLPSGEHIVPHTAPLYLSSTYIYESPEKAQEVFKGKVKAYTYARWSHPNAELIERKIELIETLHTAIDCKSLLFSSGMAAISALFQSLIKPGDSIIVQGNIYGTTVDYINHIAQQFGLQVYYCDFKQLDLLESLLKKDKKIRLLYAETPSNPSTRCYDLEALSKLAHQYKTKIAVDNTFASPYLQQPLAFGVDFVVHSATKYLNGHGSGLSGLLIGRDTAFINEQVWKIRKLYGSICAPFDAWLLNLGIKTLHLRMEEHCRNAMVVATMLEKHPTVSLVNYLGLPSHPDHVIATRQMKNYGGVLSFELKGGYKAGVKLMKKLRICKLTASLGTTDTLIQHPASMSHYFVPVAQRKEFGITDGLVRLAVGIECVDDIIGDIEMSL